LSQLTSIPLQSSIFLEHTLEITITTLTAIKKNIHEMHICMQSFLNERADAVKTGGDCT
jgi:hypothetical protein